MNLMLLFCVRIMIPYVIKQFHVQTACQVYIFYQPYEVSNQCVLLNFLHTTRKAVYRSSRGESQCSTARCLVYCVRTAAVIVQCTIVLLNPECFFILTLIRMAMGRYDSPNFVQVYCLKWSEIKINWLIPHKKKSEFYFVKCLHRKKKIFQRFLNQKGKAEAWF